LIVFKLINCFTQITYEDLETAGITREKIKGSPTGVFMGVCGCDYQFLRSVDCNEIKPYVQVKYEMQTSQRFVLTTHIQTGMCDEHGSK
jgi:acyl transferase domain-containing protein